MWLVGLFVAVIRLANKQLLIQTDKPLEYVVFSCSFQPLNAQLYSSGCSFSLFCCLIRNLIICILQQILLGQTITENEATVIFTTLGGTEKYISVGKTERRRALGRSRHVLEDVGRINLRT